MQAYTYLLCLNISVNIRHTAANTSPAVARITYTTVKGTETVTTSSIGIPSLGIPSGNTCIISIDISSQMVRINPRN